MSDTNDEDRASEERRAKLVKAGVAVGIGSAAIVAALLYASKVKKKPKRYELTVRPELVEGLHFLRDRQQRAVPRQVRDERFWERHLRPYHSSSRIS